MKIKKIISLMFLAVVAMYATGCKPYMQPKFEDVGPSETAFVIPLEGDATTQTKMQSEDMLRQHMVSAKRIQVSQREVSVGRGWWAVQYLPTVRVIKVDRATVTREWTEDDKSGTSERNQAIGANTKNGQGFIARMNIAAQIQEDDAPKFLYYYASRKLEQVMDAEIYSRISARFVNESEQYTTDELMSSKGKIMDKVSADVLPYFKERGVTITVLGLKGELKFTTPEVQATMDKSFITAKEALNQDSINSKKEKEAKAMALYGKTLLSPEGQAATNLQLKQKELENQTALIAAYTEYVKTWNGVGPVVTSSGSSMLNFPSELLESSKPKAKK